ncbi:MAG TPA: Na(+)/H(+) antiporter subunit D [Deltaproteobacteria bacterium]|nr:Na(+)/H(+) antiporter subunit D [Deltaproteobacteria bacterium]HQB39935.1 Na(+)/H(+) antiporter subunit D [Deltaproteobacteria bacterium]
MTVLPPFIFFFLAALLVPILSGRIRKAALLAAPLLALLALWYLPDGTSYNYHLLEQETSLLKVDGLNRVFGYIFCIISFLTVVYSLNNNSRLEHPAALVYAGSALGVTFAADFFTLYIFWELMAVASTFVILAARTQESNRAAFRYVMVHLCGGLFLLAGIMLHAYANNSLILGPMSLTDLSSVLIFIGVGVNAAIYPVNSWLRDAYPTASWSGTVFLSAFTTKSAVYVMARLFPGTDLLIILGSVMAIVPIIYALLENDIRGVLSYSLLNQVGIMLIGVGIGTPLALNGVVAHAFAHILYKGLLFMSAGAVIRQTGKSRFSELGGLYRHMPLTGLFCVIGAMSTSVPLFCGFVSKSLIIAAAGQEHLTWVWLILLTATAGVFVHTGVKLPLLIFFGPDSGLRPQEAPLNMLLAMGGTALLCVAVGVYPQALYSQLPFAFDYAPYTFAHVSGHLQLLLFSGGAYLLFRSYGICILEFRSTLLDTDWFYRKGGRLFYSLCDSKINRLNASAEHMVVKKMAGKLGDFFEHPLVALQSTCLKGMNLAMGESSACKKLEIWFNTCNHVNCYPIGGGVLLAISFLAVCSACYLLYA